MIKKVLLILSVLTLSTVSVFSGTTGNLTVSGTVPEILEINVITAAGANNLDLTQTVSDLHIGDVVERSNVLAGYTVTVSSANASSGSPTFVGSDPSNSDTMTYTLKYDGSAVVFSGGSALISDVGTKTTTTGSTKSLNISYDGGSNFLNADTYSDTLTFTIAAK